MYRICKIALLVTLIGGVAGGGEFVPFVIPAKVNPAAPLNIMPQPIQTEQDRIVVREGHFYRGSERIRLWGVNFSFSANWPSHEDAEHIARRLAAAGVNSIRCHHMDTSLYPRGLWQKDGKTLEPAALERLDYFIDQLARQGIYINLNLHVGHPHSQYLGLPKPNTTYDKIVNIFTPELIEAQKRYARMMLERKNPYRQRKYADDPAIAIVEITNENSLFMWSATRDLQTLPEYYAKILQEKYNRWLKQRYESTTKLKAVWSEGAEALGPNLLKNSDLLRLAGQQSIPAEWNLEQHGNCKARLTRDVFQGRSALQIITETIDGTNWHLQFNQRGIQIKEGIYYTVIFEAAAPQPRKLAVGVGQAHEPWQNLGLSKQLDLTGQWKRYRFGFVARQDDRDARISFTLGDSREVLYLARVELRPGGLTGLEEGENLEAAGVKLFAGSEAPRRARDRMRFLALTEKTYFDGMRNYLKNELACQSLITGTIVFGPLGQYGQSDMDFIDGHAYWQHPRFPRRSWDAGDWYIEQKAMTDYPDQATLFRLTAERLADKPFTVTEYNHPMPLDAQAECVPMIASFAAAQDWDGVWIYSYSHNPAGWDKKMVGSYFDMWNNPAKWGFMRAGTTIFREKGIAPLSQIRPRDITTPPDILSELIRLHIKHDRDMFSVLAEKSGVSRQDMLRVIYAPSYQELKTPMSPETVPGGRNKRTTDSDGLTWTVNRKKHGEYIARGPGAWVYTGYGNDFEEMTKGKILITQPDWVALTVTALDGRKLDDGLNGSNKILITACGRCENAGMGFSQDRRTVGRNWGEPPIRIEAVEGKITLPKGPWRCRALGPDGIPTAEVRASRGGSVSMIKLSGQYNTMWYLLTRN